VGVRKALGARRTQLAGQFLSESMLVSAAAFVLALGVAAAMLPVFNTSFGTELALFDGANGPLLAGLSACVLVIGVLAGGYPAFVLSRFQPVRVLRGTAASVASGGGWLRRGLVVVQFAISAGLIVSTVVVHQQLNYVQSKNLGFDGDQVVAVELQREGMTADGATVKQQLLQHPSVQRVSLASSMPAHVGMRLGLEPDDVAPEASTEKEVFTWSPISADFSFVETLGLKLVAGRSFDRERGADAGGSFLLNEAAVRDLGWTPEEAVGKAFSFGSDDAGQVIGVVKNFHITSLREEIIPVSISVGDGSEIGWGSGRGWVAAKLAPEGVQAGLEHIRSTFETLAPDAAFEYQFLDDTFDAMYRSEERLSNIFTAFAGIAILIACMGLFGLAAFAAERRTKEIGIRKAMGASLADIVGLLSKEFAALVAVALCIGMPAAYWGMDRWLEDFAYRMGIGPTTFVVTALVALVIAGLTVSYHALRAAHADPATALRAE
jgi:putative ABC transport system permease protein